MSSKSRKLSKTAQNWLLILAVMGLVLLPLATVRGDYSGTDGQAEAAIQVSHPTYRPWFRPLFEPASSEIESLLFAVQAALGAGVIGYVIGRYQERYRRRRPVDSEDLH